MNEKIRVTADLPLGSIYILKELAESQDISLTEALRRAIATEGLMQRYIRNGYRFYLESYCGCLTELTFRQ